MGTDVERGSREGRVGEAMVTTTVTSAGATGGPSSRIGYLGASSPLVTNRLPSGAKARPGSRARLAQTRTFTYSHSRGPRLLSAELRLAFVGTCARRLGTWWCPEPPPESASAARSCNRGGHRPSAPPAPIAPGVTAGRFWRISPRAPLASRAVRVLPGPARDSVRAIPAQLGPGRAAHPRTGCGGGAPPATPPARGGTRRQLLRGRGGLGGHAKGSAMSSEAFRAVAFAAVAVLRVYPRPRPAPFFFSSLWKILIKLLNSRYEWRVQGVSLLLVFLHLFPSKSF